METVSLLSSTSENEEETTTTKSTTADPQKSKSDNSDDDGEHWKKALLARDLDVLHTRTLMIVSDIPSTQRLQLSQNILESIKDVKRIALNEVKQENSSGVCNWKNAVVARNLDLIDTSLQIVMMDVPMSFREQLGRTIVAALQDLEKVIQNDDRPAEHLIHCTVADDCANSDRRGSKDDHKGNGVDLKNISNTNASKVSRTQYKISGYRCYRGPLPPPEAPRDIAAMREKVMQGICPICYRDLPPQSIKCHPCKIFAMRLKERLDMGFTLSCEHENNSGGVTCRSCRYNLYLMMVEEFKV
uniref:Protein SZT2 n=1 Tax=Lygus hesperus TaxID=30085 RepID=A0A0A9XAD2_LYGHE